MSGLENFNAITIEQMATSEVFITIPKVLLEDDRYSGLRLDSKMLYGILKDRLKLSAQNGWIDEEGRVYLEYSNPELQDLLGCSKGTIIKIRENLAEYGLIYEESQFTKANGQVANRIYISNVAPYDSEKYRQKRLERQEAAFLKRQKQKLDTPRTKIERGPSKICTGPVQDLDPNNIDSNNTDSSNKSSSSRKASANSDELPSPTEASVPPSQDKKGGSFVKPEIYSILQEISDSYRDHLPWEHSYNMTHKQKMLIGELIQTGWIHSSEVLHCIERIPQSCESPFAYLIRSIQNLIDERKLEAKLRAHELAEKRYTGT